MGIILIKGHQKWCPLLFNNIMEWVYTDPVRPGKYIVTTITQFNNTNVLKAIWNGKRWNFNNQIFVKYLKE